MSALGDYYRAQTANMLNSVPNQVAVQNNAARLQTPNSTVIDGSAMAGYDPYKQAAFDMQRRQMQTDQYNNSQKLSGDLQAGAINNMHTLAQTSGLNTANMFAPQDILSRIGLQNAQAGSQAATTMFNTGRPITGFADGTESVKEKGKKALGPDTVPAMLAPGEAVLNREAAEHLGRGIIEHLNQIGLMKAAGQDTSQLTSTQDGKQAMKADTSKKPTGNAEPTKDQDAKQAKKVDAGKKGGVQDYAKGTSEVKPMSGSSKQNAHDASGSAQTPGGSKAPIMDPNATGIRFMAMGGLLPDPTLEDQQAINNAQMNNGGFITPGSGNLIGQAMKMFQGDNTDYDAYRRAAPSPVTGTQGPAPNLSTNGFQGVNAPAGFAIGGMVPHYAAGVETVMPISQMFEGMSGGASSGGMPGGIPQYAKGKSKVPAKKSAGPPMPMMPPPPGAPQPGMAGSPPTSMPAMPGALGMLLGGPQGQ